MIKQGQEEPKPKMVVAFINDDGYLEECLKPHPACLAMWTHGLVKESDLE